MKAGTGGSLAFNDITFVDSGGVRLHSAAVSNGDLFIDAATNLDVDGALIITATTGNITQGSELEVGTTSTFTTSASNATITLNDADNTFTGAVALNTNGSSGNATIKNDRALLLAASSVGGALIATATAGNITQNGALDIEGITTLVTSGAGATIDLVTNGSGNAFTSELLITTNETSSDKDAHVSIDGGTTNLIIGTSTIDGNLTLRSGGTLTDTDSSTVTVKGTLTATTDASHSVITLNDLAVDGAFTLAPNGTGAVTIVNDAGLNLAASTMGGTFSGTATTGDISNTGNLAITGAATFITTANNRSIILDQSGNAFTSTVTMQAGNGSNATFNNITFVDSAAVRLHSSAASAGDLYINASTDLAVGGNLSITATTGNITQGGALDIEGTTTLVTLADNGTIDLKVNGITNAFTGKLLITTNDTGSETDGDVEIDGGDTNLIIGASTIDGDLDLVSGGTITDDGIATVRGTLT
ncbi:MAG: hypothetical protein VYB33_11500, partial [Pseudomonadota bacterium]|nr:hypothetical protein [Pseudomonadota bacterium]